MIDINVIINEVIKHKNNKTININDINIKTNNINILHYAFNHKHCNMCMKNGTMLNDNFELVSNDNIKIKRMLRIPEKYGGNDDLYNSINLCENCITDNNQEFYPHNIEYGKLYDLACEKKLSLFLQYKYKDIPYIQDMNNYEQLSQFHPEGNVFNHTLFCINIAEHCDMSPLSQMCVLLHDIGKLFTYKIRNGKHTFYGHDKIGSKFIQCIQDIPDNHKDIISFATENHMKMHLFNKMKKKKQIEISDNPKFKWLLDVFKCDSKTPTAIIDNNK